MFNILYEVVIFLVGFIKPFIPKFDGVVEKFYFLNGPFLNLFHFSQALAVLSAILSIELSFRVYKIAVFVAKMVRGA